jgi:uncharacterized protein (TIGR02246 family)
MKVFCALASLALFVAGTGLAGAAGPAAPQEPSSARGAPAESAALKGLVEAFIAAFNKGDAKAIAALFTEDGELVDEEGGRIVGRSAIGDHFAAGFAANPGAKIEISVEALRPLGPGAWLEEGRSRVTMPNGGPIETSRYVVAYVKQGDKWLQSSAREFPDSGTSHHERLKELEWLLGDWVDESADSVVFTQCAWSEDKNFLLRSFSVQVAGKPLMKGTQRIGWDPLVRQFKSWVFDSEGGYGEGLWSREGKRWVIKSTGVLPDGRAASSTNIFTPMNKDMIRWKSVDRVVGGKTVGDLPEVVMVRKPPAPSSKGETARQR